MFSIDHPVVYALLIAMCGSLRIVVPSGADASEATSVIPSFYWSDARALHSIPEATIANVPKGTSQSSLQIRNRAACLGSI